MLRHSGDRRTAEHNIKLATLLCITAGFVNAAGFLGFNVLTTNVTGHAALFAENLALREWETAKVVSLWMLLFLSGAFVCSFITRITGRNRQFSYLIPILIEIGILLFSYFKGDAYDGSLQSKEFYAGSLLFAMGMQNALVSIISGAVVRTTHLTGTFTDLGIELAQVWGKNSVERSNIRSKIKLRLVIIVSFMLGAVAGAYLFNRFGFKSFLAPCIILLFALTYDVIRIKVSRYYRSKSVAVWKSVKS